jgi:hypothetical protein
MTISDDDGNEILDVDGYAPYIQNFSGGDDLNFKIDNETGKIIGWVPLTKDNIEEILQNIE